MKDEAISLFDRYRGLSDEALREAYDAGEESYRPSAWAIISTEVAKRKLSTQKRRRSPKHRSTSDDDVGEFVSQLGKQSTAIALDIPAVRVALRVFYAIALLLAGAMAYGSVAAKTAGGILTVAAVFGGVIGGLVAAGPTGLHRGRAIRAFVTALAAGAFAGAVARSPGTALTFSGALGEATVPAFVVATGLACLLLSIPTSGVSRSAV